MDILELRALAEPLFANAGDLSFDKHISHCKSKRGP
jgi:hypothetical protein